MKKIVVLIGLMLLPFAFFGQKLKIKQIEKVNNEKLTITCILKNNTNEEIILPLPIKPVKKGGWELRNGSSWLYNIQARNKDGLKKIAVPPMPAIAVKDVPKLQKSDLIVCAPKQKITFTIQSEYIRAGIYINENANVEGIKISYNPPKELRLEGDISDVNFYDKTLETKFKKVKF